MKCTTDSINMGDRARTEGAGLGKEKKYEKEKGIC